MSLAIKPLSFSMLLLPFRRHEPIFQLHFLWNESLSAKSSGRHPSIRNPIWKALTLTSWTMTTIYAWKSTRGWIKSRIRLTFYGTLMRHTAAQSPSRSATIITSMRTARYQCIFLLTKRQKFPHTQLWCKRATALCWRKTTTAWSCPMVIIGVALPEF